MMAGEVFTLIGLSDLHYALLTKDDDTGVTYETPVHIPGLIEATINTNANIQTQFADDGPMDVFGQIGEVELSLTVTDLPLATQAILLGHELGTDGTIIHKSTDTAPNLAIGFKAQKRNGKYRYWWLLKGIMAEPSATRRTKESTVNFQTATITGKFVARNYDKAWLRQADEDETGYVETVGQNWFTDVEPAPALPSPGAEGEV